MPEIPDKIPTLEPGVWLDYPEPDYHLLPYAGKSDMWRLNTLLEVAKDHADWKAMFEKPHSKDAFAFGTYLDDLLTGDLMTGKTTVADNYTEGPTKTQGVKHKAMALMTDKTLLCLGEIDRGQRIADQVAMHPQGRTVFGPDAKYQVVVVWDDERTGVRCKARLDVLTTTNDPETGDPFPTIVDVKKTGKALEKFHYDALDYGYFVQAAHYRDGLMIAGNPDAGIGVHHNFFFFVIEDTPFDNTGWHRMSLFEYGEAEMSQALLVRDKLLDQYEMFKAGEFPVRDYSIKSLRLTEWDVAKFGGMV